MLCCAALLTSACGGSSEEYHPVRGFVFYDEKPAANAIVFLNPVNGLKKNEPRPMGRVSPDGTFVITTVNEGDGAKAGDYVVTIVWKSESKKGDSDEANLLPPRYMDPATSDLRITVVPGSNQLEPFNLTP
jgi:hypothetical protein